MSKQAPALFLKDEIDSNQNIFRKNYLAELLQEQSQMNQTLSKQYQDLHCELEDAYGDIKKNVLTESQLQQQHIQELSANFAQYEAEWATLHAAYEKQVGHQHLVTDYLQNLESKNEALLLQLKESQESYHNLLEQTAIQERTILEISRKLASFEKPHEQIIEELTSIHTDQAKIKEKIDTHDIYHLSVMEKLESQDALMEKISRAVDYLKSIIFERTAYLNDNFKSLLSPVKSFFVRHEEKNKK